ncbi:MAG: transglutaminase domain-containing protein [Planctomycetes bacterium]|nr:transglutaminase domain-containing protein [Planctomycetota bacterium]
MQRIITMLGILAAVATAAFGEELTGGGAGSVAVRERDVVPVVRNWCSEAFQFDCHANAMLHTLRRQEKLDDVLARGATEFEKQAALMDWTYRRFRFGPPGRQGVANKPLEILKALDEGAAFNCAYYADVCSAALRSCGYVTRGVGLKGARSDGNGAEHAVLEVWSNQYRKWVLLDPTGNLYCTSAGVPLNAWEIRQAWFARKGRDLTLVVDGKPHGVSDLPIDRGTHPGFGRLEINDRSLGKFAILAYTPERPDGNPDYGRMFITRDQYAEGIEYHTRRNPTDPAVEPYFPVQQTDIALDGAGDGILAVRADTLTPDFAGWRHRLDSGDWAEGAPSTWTLHAGTNTLEIAAVNKFGVVGRPSRVVVERK